MGNCRFEIHLYRDLNIDEEQRNQPKDNYPHNTPINGTNNNNNYTNKANHYYQNNNDNINNGNRYVTNSGTNNNLRSINEINNDNNYYTINTTPNITNKDNNGNNNNNDNNNNYPNNNINKSSNNVIVANSKSKILTSLLDPKENYDKENIIKTNLNAKIPKMGKVIKYVEYENLIKDHIKNYIKRYPLNYKNYTPKDTVTYKSLPIKFNNGNCYYGNWNENCLMEGYGIYYIKEDDVVTEGVWLKGILIFGRIFLSNGDIYEGEINNSVFNGKGKLNFFNGEIYEGDFFEGEMSGNGTFIFPDKTKYEGQIKNGLFHGKGKMEWSNGMEYEGSFKESEFCGMGILKNIQGEKYDGYFDKNDFNGKGEYFYRNGDVFIGNYENGLKKGKGIYKKSDKMIFEGVWNNDLPDGQGVVSYNGNKIKGYWRNGFLVGNTEIIEGSLENFNDVDLNISPCKQSIYPLSLPHLVINDVNLSQFSSGIDNMSFL